jgi:L-lysine exporter family protein LysE/ArgO
MFDIVRPAQTLHAMQIAAFSPLLPAFNAGMLLSLSLIIALGPQNIHILRMGLRREHLWLTIAVCTASDVALIALGVMGLAQLDTLPQQVLDGMVVLGIVFLLVYGAKSFGRFRAAVPLHVAEEVSDPSLRTASDAVKLPLGRGRALGAALAFAWLNPHAWLDTAVLIGTASLAWSRPGNAAFGLGAMTGSALWFVGLGACIMCFGRRLHTPWVWRALDGVAALMAWGTAAMLGWGLVAH